MKRNINLIWNISGKIGAIILIAVPIIFMICLMLIPLQDRFSVLNENTKAFYILGFGLAGLSINLTWIYGMRENIINLWSYD